MIKSDKNSLAKLYQRYGDDLSLTEISKTLDKTVYNMVCKEGEFVVLVVPSFSAVRFYKYMSSQGLQNSLYEAGFPVAKIDFAYIADGDAVSVHQKLSGTNSFARTADNLRQMGALIGKLHRTTMSKEYNETKLLLQYPHLLGRMAMLIRMDWFKKVSCYFKYWRARRFPKGICHRDINEHNIFINNNEQMMLIDFDMYRYMPLVEGIARFYKGGGLPDKTKIGVFLEGYESERPLTKEEKDYLKVRFKEINEMKAKEAMEAAKKQKVFVDKCLWVIDALFINFAVARKVAIGNFFMDIIDDTAYFLGIDLF